MINIFSFILSKGGGNSLFDPWSLYHIIFFIAITLILYSIIDKNIWLYVLIISILWEICEYWLVNNISQFPYVGHESLINKWIGDPISNFFGYFIAIWLIDKIRKRK